MIDEIRLGEGRKTPEFVQTVFDERVAVEELPLDARFLSRY